MHQNFLDMKKKDAYYFTHDSNARNDEKTLSLRMKHGWEGYGLYWAIVEKLRESSEYMCVRDYNLIAYDLRVDSAKVKSIIEDFRLFTFTEDSECFYSESLCERMEKLDNKREKASNAGKASAEKRNNINGRSTDVQRTFNGRSTIKLNESKENESKENESKVKESKEEQSKEENTPRSPYYSKFDFQFLEEWAKDAFRKWLNYKFELKEPYKTQQAIEQVYKKLEQLSGRDPSIAMKVVDNVIEKEAHSLFELPTQKPTTNPNKVKAMSQKETDLQWEQSRKQA